MKVKEKSKLVNELEALRRLFLELRESEIQQEHTKAVLKALADQLKKIEVECRSVEEQLAEDILFNCQNQTILSNLLHISLLNISFEEKLNMVIDEVTSISWLGLKSKGAVYLVEDNPNVLVMKASRGLEEFALGSCTRVPFGRCICGRAASSGRIDFVSLVDKRHGMLCEEREPHGHFCVPIISDSRILGVINLYTKEGRVHEEKQDQFLKAIADIVAGIIKSDEAEKQRSKSQGLYKVLVEMAPDGVALLDKKGFILSCNTAALDITGYSKEEIVGKHFTKLGFLHAGNISKYAKIFTEMVRSGTCSNIEIKAHRKDGSSIWLKVRVSPLKAAGIIEGLQIVARDITQDKIAEKDLKRNYAKLQKAMTNTIKAMALTVEMKDPYTAGHQQRVSKIAVAIAKKMGISVDRIYGIKLAGVVHDIGKIYVAAEILSKPGPITEAEFNIIKLHPRVGYDILKNIDFPWPIAKAVLQHHERINGSGYPSGLVGEEICLEARILAVADVIEAMAADRPYRPALGIDAAVEEVVNNKGILYDPQAVSACAKVLKKKQFRFK